MVHNRSWWPALLAATRTLWSRVPAWAGEWLLIALWGLWLGRAYLNLDVFLWPAGYGLGLKLFGHAFWIDLQRCGLCALWNGTLNGGRPAFADLFGSQFHPLIALFTLMFGVTTGYKLSAVAILILGGLAQWCLAQALRLGRLARVWSGLLAAAGGHLATQQWEGNFGLSLALVSAAFVIAAVLALAAAPTRRGAVRLALAGALLLVSGQGYVQVVVLAWAPALLLLRLQQTPAQAARYFRELALAVGLSVLLTACLLLPVMHFWPNFTKDTAPDPTYAFAQPLAYVPFNYVINDPAYFQTATLGKPATADLPYIGWVPILLALAGLRLTRRADLPAVGFLSAAAFTAMLLAAGIPMRWLGTQFPYLLWLKNVHVLADAAVPALLGLAALGLDRVWQAAWPRLRVSLEGGWGAPSFDTRWLLVPVLLGSLATTSAFVQRYMVPQDVSRLYLEYVRHFRTDTAEWVAPPDDPVWAQPALDQGSKLTLRQFSGSGWAGRAMPAPYLVVAPEGFTADKPFEQIDTIETLAVYRLPTNEYAYVTYADGTQVACPAKATGGYIRVRCATTQPGRLTVTENTWSGWYTWLDGHAAPLRAPGDAVNAPWLQADAPAGEHVYEFKYLPWDVFVGLALTLLGWGVAAYWWRQRERAWPRFAGAERAGPPLAAPVAA